MGQLRDGVQHFLEDGQVVCSTVDIHVKFNGCSCCASMCHVGLCRGEGDREALVGLVEHYVSVADGYADELHLVLDCLEGRDEGGVLAFL